MEVTERSNNKNDLLEKIKEVEFFRKKTRQYERRDKIFKNTLMVLGTCAAAYTGYLSYQHYIEGENYKSMCETIVTASNLFWGYFGYGMIKKIHDRHLTPKEIKEYKKKKKNRINLN